MIFNKCSILNINYKVTLLTDYQINTNFKFINSVKLLTIH